MTLSLADAFAIHDAIHDPAASSVTLSNGVTLPVFVSKNGSRRCDVVGPDGGNPTCKFMSQNVSPGKTSATANRARLGAQITHILPLDSRGRHTDGADWGRIDREAPAAAHENVLGRNCTKVLDQADVAQYRRGPKAAARPPKNKLEGNVGKRKLSDEAAREETETAERKQKAVVQVDLTED